MRSRVDNHQVKPDGTSIRCGQLAGAAGVSPDTIRHYEKIGVLPKAERTLSGYRMYPKSAIQRVAVVQRALRIGFTLAEMSEIFKARDAGGAPCRRVYTLGERKLNGIRAEIAALKQTERFLKTLLADWRQRLGGTGKGQRAHLLHSLVEAVKNPDDGLSNRFRRKT